ncbi:NlpC/P60 family protein [Streptomyces rubradiris]|uniref:C40 family peptidase n=1 Tax=Streptomyces rubradiris TaxID=285531 RepID=UPI0036E5C2E8
MASHRKPRPGGSRPAVVHTPALTSMAVFSRPTESAPTADQGIPTPEEIARKVDDFYRQAESALIASAEGSGAGERWGRGERGVRTARGGREQQGARTAQGGPGERRDGGTEAERARFADGGLERLRDEVARWARQRTLPGARGMVPAQRGTGQSGPGMSQAGPGSTQAEPGISLAGPGTRQAERCVDQTERRTHHTGLSTSRAEPRADEPLRGTDLTRRGTSGPQGTSCAEPGTSQAPLGTGHVTHGTVRVSRSTGEVEHATLPTGGPAALAPPLHPTLPRQAMQAPPTAQRTVGVAAPAGSGLEPINRRLEPTARRPDTTTPRSGTTAGGPKAAKVVTREKLTHARVLLYRHQRIARTLGTPPGTYATKAGKAVAFARSQLGAPCVWGAAGPGSYDCAGLTRAAWQSAGVTLPRTASAQAGVGIPVPPAEARPGDLVFFHDDAGHVGLCTGAGMMIHAPRPGAYVREQPVSALGEAAVHSVVRPG